MAAVLVYLALRKEAQPLPLVPQLSARRTPINNNNDTTIAAGYLFKHLPNMQRVQSYIPSVRDLAARTVHVKMYPTARTFRERREVLRVMERFGEVTMFQSLKVTPLMN